ncbi:MAG: O-methyltransferase [Vicinamibacterales bacterium]|jgi:predicted O-methyltransferase YrrM|nr:O-methyltransferase [Vicinamibacterales bacterium]
MPEFVHIAVQDYLSALNGPEDGLLQEVRARALADGVPAISPDTGRLLDVLAASSAPGRILEIGTGYGSSGMHLASALAPGGMLFTIERDPARAAIARQHFERAGLASRVSVMVGEAARLVHKVAGPFDLILQDGPKDLYEPLLDRLVGLLRPGGVLVSDNILWQGDVMPGFRSEPAHSAESSAIISRYSQRLAADPRLSTVFLPVGDGVAVSARRDGGAS